MTDETVGVLPQRDVYEEAVRLRRVGRRAALATIVRSLGSTPRKDCAKMLVREDGSIVGTIGGGAVEAEVCRQALQVIQRGEAQLLTYEFKGEDADEEVLICGGTLEVFVEPILPEPELVIMGAGHVGLALARAAAPLGFRITVIDDRADFACRERFPNAHRIVLTPFAACLESLEVNPNCYLVIVTRGHRHDQTCLEQAVLTPAAYVGMVGSRRKVVMIVQNLIRKGTSPPLFTKLYAPVGLDIGSDSPEEIAVSIMGEIIAVRKGVHQRNEKQRLCLAAAERQGPGDRGRGEEPGRCV